MEPDNWRIYIDESGTHGGSWLAIGMLFVPEHGPLHSDLCAAKEQLGYLNGNKKRSARYKETHFTEFKRDRDVELARLWADAFLKHTCYFRSIVVDWSIWEGKYFGTPFEPDALKKRRAYKKWAEMLLQPEMGRFRNATAYLDRLRVVYGYDVLQELELRFAPDRSGKVPAIREYQLVDSWKDAHQCLQLCDLFLGAIKQSLEPAPSSVKRTAATTVADRLRSVGVAEMRPGYWKGFDRKTLAKHHPKFSEWFWRPDREAWAEWKRRRGNLRE